MENERVTTADMEEALGIKLWFDLLSQIATHNKQHN